MTETNTVEGIGNTATIAAVDAEMCSSQVPEDSDKNGTTKRPNETKTSAHIVYNPKKPKWWNRLGNNGRDATKSQKRAMRKVLDGAEGTTTDASATQGLRLPPIPYGSKLDWDEIFPKSSEENRDIWLELGFGRGENLQALLESKLWKEQNQKECEINKSENGDEMSHGNDVRGGMTLNTNVRQAKSRKFHLVGAEVSGVGIGCLCKRIEQLQKEREQETNHCDDHFVLYSPEMDPYSSVKEGIATADECGKTAKTHTGSPILWKEQRTTLVSSYSDRFRIHTGDGYKLLPKLPDGSLSAILITFPDPFPKESDVNYRLVQHQTLIQCHRILRKGRPFNPEDNDNTSSNNNDDWNGRLFLATDHDGYHEWCHKIMNEVNSIDSSSSILFQMEEPCPNRMEWLPAVSRYEQKGWDEGRSTKLSCWVAV